MALLRSTFGIYITVYMDVCSSRPKTKSEAYLHSQITILVLLCLGWEINRDKSNLIQSHEITHIGFCINTNSMTATLPGDKISSLKDFASITLNDGFISVHDAEKILGLIESVRPVTVSQPWLPFIIEAPEGEICQIFLQ